VNFRRFLAAALLVISACGKASRESPPAEPDERLAGPVGLAEVERAQSPAPSASELDKMARDFTELSERLAQVAEENATRCAAMGAALTELMPEAELIFGKVAALALADKKSIAGVEVKRRERAAKRLLTSIAGCGQDPAVVRALERLGAIAGDR